MEKALGSVIFKCYETGERKDSGGDEKKAPADENTTPRILDEWDKRRKPPLYSGGSMPMTEDRGG